MKEKGKTKAFPPKIHVLVSLPSFVKCNNLIYSSIPLTPPEFGLDEEIKEKKKRRKWMEDFIWKLPEG